MQPHVQNKFKDKQKIEKNAESVKPTVINDTLIECYMHDYHRENKIFDQEHMRIWDLTHLSLSFKSKPPVSYKPSSLDIVEIDNL